MRFGEVLQRERLKAGLTQAQLSEKSGVPLGTIRDYEQAKRDPQLSTARKLALAIGVSLDLLSDTEDPAVEEPKKRTRKKKGE